MIKELIDLSHPISDLTDCTFNKNNTIPNISFIEANGSGSFYITSQLNSLNLSSGTHLCFPGSLPQNKLKKTHLLMNIGEYPLSTFVGNVLIVDVTYKFKSIHKYFDQSGKLNLDLRDTQAISEYLEALKDLTLTLDEFSTKLRNLNTNLSTFKGIIFYTGLSSCWTNNKYESWEYIYFVSLNLSQELCDFLNQNNISFVGIDSFRLGHPLVIYSGYEKIFSANLSLKQEFLKNINIYNELDAQQRLLNENILIYQNLSIKDSLIDQACHFTGVPLQLTMHEANTHSIVRPFIQLA